MKTSKTILYVKIFSQILYRRSHRLFYNVLSKPFTKLFFSSMYCKEEYFCALQAVFQFLLKVFMNNINQILLGLMVHACVCLYTSYTPAYTVNVREQALRSSATLQICILWPWLWAAVWKKKEKSSYPWKHNLKKSKLKK